MALKIQTFDPMMLWSSCRDFRTSTGRPAPLLHGEVGDVGISGDLELEDALGGGGVPVEHGAVHRGEGVAGHDGGLDGEFLDVRFSLLQKRTLKQHYCRTNAWTSPGFYFRKRGTISSGPAAHIEKLFLISQDIWFQGNQNVPMVTRSKRRQMNPMSFADFMAQLRAWRTSCASRPERASLGWQNILLNNFN